METIERIAVNVNEGAKFVTELGNFLDAFYLDPRSERIQEAPALIMGNKERDAYLAAVAEKLARDYRLPIPAWAFDACRYLNRPWFAMKAASFRATLLLESPGEFRSRNLFVTENALDRASQHCSDELNPFKKTAAPTS